MNGNGFGTFIEKLRKNPQTIVMTEGTDERVLEASSRLLASNFLKPILLGNPDEIQKKSEEAGFNIRGAQIVDPMTYDKIDEMVDLFCEIRKDKGLTPEEARELLSHPNYFGTMMIKMGLADCMLGSSSISTSDTVRPALQIIKTKPGRSNVSACVILVRPSATGENEVLAMADCGINERPTVDQLVEICEDTANCAKNFGISPKIAFLSYSTKGSGHGEDVDRMRNAANKAREEYPELMIEGDELQFDAAVSPRVARQKCPNSKVAGYANTFIFLDLNAANMGYKIAQRMGNFEAYGLILLGLNARINNFSWGSNAMEVYSMAILTAALDLS